MVVVAIVVAMVVVVNRTPWAKTVSTVRPKVTGSCRATTENEKSREKHKQNENRNYNVITRTK